MSVISPRRFAQIARSWYVSRSRFTIEEPEERTNLINNSDTHFITYWYDKVLLVILGVIVILGVAASTYLLFGEKNPVVADYLVPRRNWTTWPSCTKVSTLQLPIQRVMLSSTNTSECWNRLDCLTELLELQEYQVEKSNAPDIPYNFILAGDQMIYEGRGWNCSSKKQEDGLDVLTIAFLGKYETVTPSNKQIKILKSLLDYGVANKYLSSCYQLLANNSSAQSISDVVRELEQRREKDIC